MLSTVSTSVAERSVPVSTTVCPSVIVSALFPRTGASFWFVNVIVAASGPSDSAPSDTVTEYPGAASPPSCTNWMSPAITCACVNVVIAAPGFATSSNCPPVTPETVNCSVESTLSTSVAETFAPVSTTVCPSVIVSALFTSVGASFWFVKVIVAASGPSESAPSDTVTEYAGAASPPSCTNWISPAVTCACVNAVIATPGFATSSNWPPETPETVN